MKHFGKQKPRYSFFLNRYDWFRASKCLKCNKLTALRKFAFLIHFEKIGLISFGLTARYCSKCEFIVLHQKDIEAEFSYKLGEAGKDFFIIGTVDKKTWKKGLEEKTPTLPELLENTADFKKVLDYEIQPAGWYFDGEK